MITEFITQLQFKLHFMPFLIYFALLFDATLLFTFNYYLNNQNKGKES